MSTLNFLLKFQWNIDSIIKGLNHPIWCVGNSHALKIEGLEFEYI